MSFKASRRLDLDPRPKRRFVPTSGLLAARGRPERLSRGFRLVDRAVVVAGHSLGEYSALAAAGSFSVPQAARLLRLRGTAMQKGAYQPAKGPWQPCWAASWTSPGISAPRPPKTPPPAANR